MFTETTGSVADTDPRPWDHTYCISLRSPRRRSSWSNHCSRPGQANAAAAYLLLHPTAHRSHRHIHLPQGHQGDTTGLDPDAMPLPHHQLPTPRPTTSPFQKRRTLDRTLILYANAFASSGPSYLPAPSKDRWNRSTDLHLRLTTHQLRTFGGVFGLLGVTPQIASSTKGAPGPYAVATRATVGIPVPASIRSCGLFFFLNDNSKLLQSMGPSVTCCEFVNSSTSLSGANIPPCTNTCGKWGLAASTWNSWLLPGALSVHPALCWFNVKHDGPGPSTCRFTQSGGTSRIDSPCAPSHASPPSRVNNSRLVVCTSIQEFAPRIHSTPVPVPLDE